MPSILAGSSARRTGIWARYESPINRVRKGRRHRSRSPYVCPSRLYFLPSAVVQPFVNSRYETMTEPTSGSPTEKAVQATKADTGKSDDKDKESLPGLGLPESEGHKGTISIDGDVPIESVLLASRSHHALKYWNRSRS